MKKTIVVTGAAGFIGCNTVAELNRRGEERLLLVDELGTDDKWKNLVGLKFDDIVAPDDFLLRVEQDDLKDVRGIVHLGACSSTTERDADYLLQNNYRYTRTLAEWSAKHEVRFVYASSGATYGDGSLGYSDEDAVTPTLAPLNMYGYSKHMVDLWALKNGMFQGANPIVGLKYFNVYGPHEEHKGEMRSVVHKSYGQIEREGKVRLFKSYLPGYADGEQKRDFLYVKDAVDVTLYFLEENKVGGLFNCGTGEARTWKSLAQAVFDAMGRESKIEYIEMPETLRGKYQYFTEAKIEKLRAAGYDRKFMSIEEGVREYVQTYLAAKGN
ncbi:ADP-glyceromanno-heptose 6-epimerase [Terriglobus saanensis]|uniref:ADP-L-glycero-D-manno-heptose-6-epimerase n=1 Tax=Terriglobus saanensis (strain ATCC BAA-1853 / DSM 23119 / SP1PR4) TaxID=401053 RepID=E8V002_TERSS|nr:ADP-glyceromanno-heptose 6-epimerase [Terriglobus saanensis]ADV82157.1 ADP-L-glycero-D-manno-heptose-6-epimerase [Terriglobus saanensis SP1PR4]